MYSVIIKYKEVLHNADRGYKKSIESVAKKYSIKRVVLFGSRADGTNTPESDIDIAVITDDIKTDKLDEEINLMQLRWDIDLRIEPHIITIADYENDETPLIVEVKNTGIELKVA